MEVIARIGDTCAEDHGGGAIVCTAESIEWVVVDEHGRRERRIIRSMALEYTHGLESEYPGEDRYGDDVGDLVLEVFQVPLDESAWEMLGPHGQEKLWQEIAGTYGHDYDDVVALAKSDDPLKIAGALEMYAGHYGWRNLDEYPMRLTYAEVEERWES